jgi:hypothetical protein
MMAIPINAEVVMEDMLDRFESANPDINVILDVVPTPPSWRSCLCSWKQEKVPILPK